MERPETVFASAEASIDIDAATSVVYDLVSDLPRMGEWSPEAVGGRWKDGGSGKVGDWFEGDNRTSDREWTRDVEVAVAEPGREFTFAVGGVEANRTWWSYQMAPNNSGGTTLTERWWIVNLSPALEAATDEQVQARVAMTTPMLESTIAAVKATAEAA